VKLKCDEKVTLNKFSSNDTPPEKLMSKNQQCISPVNTFIVFSSGLHWMQGSFGRNQSFLILQIN